ncbi:2-hydroxyacyl-CoA dehydratase family protein [Sphingomonas sp.]|uniref:2-hydroxyacyl-CoA dehydratase family protein n=1 Tax=Sphingomonas sp. TaxID=28214 RepID=UPI001B28B526|nr:2-hydroxyacyl-CoA dehydratase family protein [Sphingomonas sp.]MBO9714577.1 2-hydroxyacyl-CoA dehydratase [Sphingomonas sp.]
MTAGEALAAFRAAAADPGAVAAQVRGERRVVWMLGSDLPYELVEAFGQHPVRLVPDRRIDTQAIDALVNAETMGVRGRALLAAIVALPREDALLISHADSEQPQIFATLRELARTGAIAKPDVHFLDLLTIDRPATRTYNRARIEQAAAWLGGAADWTGAFEAGNRRRALLRDVLGLRAEGRLSGTDAHAILAGAAVLPSPECCAALEAIRDLPRREGRRFLLSGSDIEDIAVVEAIEAAGLLILGENHGWGELRARRDLHAAGDPINALAATTLAPRSGPFSNAARRAGSLAVRAEALDVEGVLHLRIANDDSAPWEVAALREALGDRPLFLAEDPITPERIAAALAGETPAHEAPFEAPQRGTPRPARSRKSLDAIARFGAYQREWFATVRAQAANCEPFAAVNANAPQEILRALGVPFVVNQWWASIVAAKQQSARYAALLRAHDLPGDVEAYSAQGIAALFEEDAERAPWGGLPRPDLLGAVLITDATARIFEAWAERSGALLQSYERSIESRWDIPIDWWDGLADGWDDLIEPERLDLFEAGLREAIGQIEALTGRTLDPARLEHIMDLVNAQQRHYRATRDLVARTVPAPVSVVDTMPATMVPQWHRGTEWARDAAQAFHDEVAARAAAGEAACPNERIRLMFVGRGLWSDMGFYQRWEESHGAVFVCSMYLSLAADGYIREHHGGNLVRALAARFVTMGDELRMPSWAGAWHVKEARLHQCDGAVALSDADPLVIRALREAGIAVLELGMDNYVRDEAAEADLDARVVAFLEGPAGEASRKRLDD